MMRKARVAIAVLGAWGCAARVGGAPEGSASVRDGADAPAGSNEAVQVAIVHAPDRDAWRVLYRLPAAVRNLPFARAGAPPRARHWTVVTPGLAIAGEPDAEHIVSLDGRAFEAIELDIATYEIHPEKDYQLFFSYTDGSRLVFTGQLDVRVPGAAPSSFTFVPRPTEHVVVEGRLSLEPTTWVSRGEGTYVCFGRTRPVIGDGFIGVVDAGLPRWLGEPIESLLPLVFRFYAERTGVSLTIRPAVYTSFRLDPEPGLQSIGGGALPGVLQQEIRLGSAVLAGPREPLVERARHGIAHEVAHLWNGHLYHPAEAGADWMSEGGADAFTYAALGELGLLGHERVAELEGEAFSKCLLGAGLGPLHGASVPGRFGLYYSCGHLIAHLTDVLARRASPARDLFSFWGELIRGARDGRYDEAVYLSQLRVLPGGSAAEAAVRSLLAGSSKTIAADLLAVDPQLAVVTPEVLPSRYHELAGLVAVTLLLRQVSGHDETPVLEPGGWRAPGLPELVIAELEGHDALARGADAYDAAATACAKHGSVTAGVRSTVDGDSSLVPRVLKCPPSFPARPPYVRPMAPGSK